MVRKIDRHTQKNKHIGRQTNRQTYRPTDI